jgi:hypothetical protein
VKLYKKSGPCNDEKNFKCPIIFQGEQWGLPHWQYKYYILGAANIK